MDAEIKEGREEPAILATAQGPLNREFRMPRFTDDLESAFSEYHFQNTLTQARIALLIGILLYAAFGLVDLMLLPEDKQKMWFIRYAVVCPIATAGLFFTYSAKFKHFMQPTLWLVMLVGSLGIVTMVHLDPAPEKNFYYTGLLLLVMAAFTFAGMRFWYAISWALTTTLAYEVVAIFGNTTASSVLVHNSFCILATITIGTFSNYLMESYMRRDFHNAILLESEKRQLQETSKRLHRLSISDELTGLGNRRQFECMLDQEWMRAMRFETPISLVIFDIDFFKNYNDNYGHQAGDNCLRLVAEEIGSFARRPGDMAARYGGEEFVLILSGSGLTQAASIAEACRVCVESLGVPHSFSKANDVVTVSAGVATLVPDKDYNRSTLVEAADKALYQAKREGRNRVAMASCATTETDSPLPDRETCTRPPLHRVNVIQS